MILFFFVLLLLLFCLVPGKVKEHFKLEKKYQLITTIIKSRLFNPGLLKYSYKNNGNNKEQIFRFNEINEFNIYEKHGGRGIFEYWLILKLKTGKNITLGFLFEKEFTFQIINYLKNLLKCS